MAAPKKSREGTLQHPTNLFALFGPTGRRKRGHIDMLLLKVYIHKIAAAFKGRSGVGGGIYRAFLKTHFFEISGIREKIAQLAGSRKSAFLKVRFRNFWNFEKKSPS